MHTGRNEPCHCGSGKKFKHCCLQKDSSLSMKARLMIGIVVTIMLISLVMVVNSIRSF